MNFKNFTTHKTIISTIALSLFVAPLVGCASQQPNPTVASGAACGSLGSEGQEMLERVYQPGTIVAATPIKERIFKARANQPIRTMGATLRIRADADMNAPYLNRVLSCHAASGDGALHPNDPLRPQSGALAQLRVVESGSGYGVEVRADDPKVGQEIWQRAEALTQGTGEVEVEVEQVGSRSPAHSF